jgi:DNA-binding transcriptional ArsR family regulator
MSNEFFLHCKKAAAYYRAINHKLRRDIMERLAKGELNVRDLQIQLKLEQSVVSQQLGILRDAKLVKTERRGKYIYYTVNQAGMDAIMSANISLGII